MGACCSKYKSSKPPGIFQKVEAFSLEQKLKSSEEAKVERLSQDQDSPLLTRPSTFNNLILYCQDPPISYEIHYIESITVEFLKSHILHKFPDLQGSEIVFYRDSEEIQNIKGKISDLGIHPGDTITIQKQLYPARNTEEFNPSIQIEISPIPRDSISSHCSQLEDSKNIELSPSKRFRNYLRPLSINPKIISAYRTDTVPNYFENNVRMKSYIHDILIEQVFESSGFLFKDQLGRDLARGTDRIINTLIQTMNDFFHNKAIAIHQLVKIPRSELEIQDLSELVAKRGYDVNSKLDTFLEKTWRLATQNTASYYKLCNLLVGKCIDRIPVPKDEVSIIWSRKIWPHYNETIAEYENLHTLWLKQSEYYDLIHGLKKYIVKKFAVFSYDIILSSSIDKAITKARAFLSRYVPIQRISKSVDSCIYTDSSKLSHPVSEILQKIESLLNKDFFSTMLHKEYNISDSSLASEYLQEYIRFLTLQYYTSVELFPSGEVEYLWNLHSSLTRDYREMCMSVYGKLIGHNVPDLDDARNLDAYIRTLSLYEYIFQEVPPSGIWPSVENRFSNEYIMASWVSILRVFALMVGFFKEGVFNSTTDTGFIKQHINIYYMSWPENDSSGFEFLQFRNRKMTRVMVASPHRGLKQLENLPSSRSKVYNPRSMASPPMNKQNFRALLLENNQKVRLDLDCEKSLKSDNEDSRSFSDSSEDLDCLERVDPYKEVSIIVEEPKSVVLSVFSERVSDCSIGKESIN